MAKESLSFKDTLNVILNSLDLGLITKAEAINEILECLGETISRVFIGDKISIEDADELYQQHGVYLHCDNGRIKYAAREGRC